MYYMYFQQQLSQRVEFFNEKNKKNGYLGECFFQRILWKGNVSIHKKTEHSGKNWVKLVLHKLQCDVLFVKTLTAFTGMHAFNFQVSAVLIRKSLQTKNIPAQCSTC